VGVFTQYEDVWLPDGLRRPFVDYNGPLGQVSPIDLGIKVVREVFTSSGVPPGDVGHVFAGSMAHASHDAFLLPRELRRSGMRYGIASACIGGGQGIALLIENPAAAG
jgi:acetyl-CoA C-acetyltransferase